MIEDRANKWYKSKRKLLLDKYGNKCLVCPSKEKLEFAHVHGQPTKMNGTGRGRNHRIRDIIANPNSYVLLCHSCHTQYDAYDKGKEVIEK